MIKCEYLGEILGKMFSVGDELLRREAIFFGAWLPGQDGVVVLIYLGLWWAYIAGECGCQGCVV